MRHVRYAVWWLMWVGLLAACGGGPQTPTATPSREDVQNAPMAEAPSWREPVRVIDRDNAAELAYLGRLDAPIANSGTFFAHAFSIDGTRLVALNQEYIVGWDIVSGEMLFYSTRQGAVTVFFSPDKTRAYTLDGDGLLRTFNTDSGEQAPNLTLHEDYGSSYAYDENAGMLAVAGVDGIVRVWDLPAREVLAALDTTSEQVFEMQFSSDGAMLALTTADGTVQVWDWRERERIVYIVPNPSQLLNRVAFAPDGNTVAVGTAEDIRVWDVETGELLHILPTGADSTDDVLTYSRDGAFLLNSGIGSVMNIWRVADGTLAAAVSELGGEPTSVAFSLDGRVMVSAVFQRGVNLWDFTTVGDGVMGQAVLPVSGNPVDVGWSPDGRTIAFFDASSVIYIWGVPAPDVETPQATESPEKGD